MADTTPSGYGKYRMALSDRVWHLCDCRAMSSSLEDRIRLLTDRAIAAKTQSELDVILPELKAAIGDQIRYLRAIAVETIPEVFGTQSKAADSQRIASDIAQIVAGTRFPPSY